MGTQTKQQNMFFIPILLSSCQLLRKNLLKSDHKEPYSKIYQLNQRLNHFHQATQTDSDP
jgi:hypothetical protein